MQNDRFDSTASITVAPLTTTHIEAPFFRVRVEPSDGNGLRVVSHVMADKVATVPRKRLGRRIGVLGGEDIARLDRAIAVFLGLAG